MKVLEIHGKLSVAADLSHQKMLIKLYSVLKENGFHFIGETKEVNDIVNNK